MNEYSEDEKLFYALFHSLRDYAFILTETGVIWGVNEYALSRLGCGEREVIGRQLSGFADFENTLGLGKIIKGMTHGKPFVGETTLKSPGNRKVPVEITMNVVTVSDNEIVLALCHDITMRKEIETMLEKRENKYKAIVQTFPEGFLMINREGKILDTNEAYAQLSGYSREELLSMTYFDLLFLKVGERVPAKVPRKNSGLFERPHKTKSGEIIPVGVNFKSWNNELEPGVIFLFISNRKNYLRLTNQIQKEKLYMKSLLSALFNDDTTGIMIVKPGSGVYYVNEFLCENFGYEKSEMKKLSPKDFVAANMVDRGMENIMKVFTGVLPNVTDKGVHLIHKNGNIIKADVMVSRLSDNSDNDEEKFILIQMENFSNVDEKEKAG